MLPRAACIVHNLSHAFFSVYSTRVGMSVTESVKHVVSQCNYNCSFAVCVSDSLFERVKPLEVEFCQGFSSISESRD